MREREFLLKSNSGTFGYLYEKKKKEKNLTPYLIPFTKFNLNRSTGLNVKVISIKFPWEKKEGKYIFPM